MNVDGGWLFDSLERPATPSAAAKWSVSVGTSAARTRTRAGLMFLSLIALINDDNSRSERPSRIRTAVPTEGAVTQNFFNSLMTLGAFAGNSSHRFHALSAKSRSGTTVS